MRKKVLPNEEGDPRDHEEEEDVHAFFEGEVGDVQVVTEEEEANCIGD